METGLIIQKSVCAALVADVSSTEKDRSHTSSVITDIQRVARHLPEYRFSKISREGSRPTHELARISRMECSGGVLQTRFIPSLRVRAGLEGL